MPVNLLFLAIFFIPKETIDNKKRASDDPHADHLLWEI